VWTDLAVTEIQGANRAAKILVLAVFAVTALLVGHIARSRRHPHRRLITILGWAYAAGLVVYIRTMRPTERWSIWAIAALGFGILLIWSYGGGSPRKPE
jgi:hypothetical protein